MRIVRKSDAVNISKSEGTNVSYYLFDEYEVHYNEQVSNTTQTWHHHEKIWETVFIVEGELVVEWKENGEIKSEIVKKGDLIESENTPHTFSNNSGSVVKFLVFKQKLHGENNRELFKNDKVLD